MYPRNVATEHAVNILKLESLKALEPYSFLTGRAFANRLVPCRSAGKAITQIPMAMNPMVRTAQPNPLDVII